MLDADDNAAAAKWMLLMGYHKVLMPDAIRAMREAYIAGVAAERGRNRRLILSMAKRIAAQSEKLTRKARRKQP